MDQPATPDSRDGLTQAEGQARLAQYGYNELPDKKDNPLLKFLWSFWGPIPWMIEAVVILSALVGHWADFGIILTLLVVTLALLPMVVLAPMQTTMMRASMTAYSTAVGPSSRPTKSALVQ
jgi:magnesium-transporting ATPase (P-type)